MFGIEKKKNNHFIIKFYQAIREEERKKNKASEPADSGLDELTIYLRSPAPTTTTQVPTSRRLSQLSKRGAEDAETISDKIEIDSDNIETPPATRRLFSPPKDIKLTDKDAIKRSTTSTTPNRDDNNAYTDLGSGNIKKSYLLLFIDLMTFLQ